MEKGQYKDNEEKEKWRKVIAIDLISSDDSDTDEEEDVMVTRPLPWRSAHVTNFFHQLDAASLRDKTPQSRRQRKRRVEGSPSARPHPMIEGIPDWAFSDGV